jgi:uncharacterized repeat protein (TIGR03803 family)
MNIRFTSLTNHSTGFIIRCLAAILCIGAATTAVHAQSVNLVYGFAGTTDGSSPSALIHASDGNLYGEALGDNANGIAGTIFRLTPAGDFKVLYTFTGGNDGAAPIGGLVEGPDGNFYGIAAEEGANQFGTLFKVTPSGEFTLLYTFGDDDNAGVQPNGPLTLGEDGNFYGTTQGGGPGPGTGSVYKITPAGKATLITGFTSSNNQPLATVIQGTDGNFYGTTNGPYGSVYKVTPSGTYTSLYSFNSTTGGAGPQTPLVEGSDGNFYGTTVAGNGDDAFGTIFKVTPAGSVTYLHVFDGNDGSAPFAPLFIATDGNFYGTTYNLGDGASDGNGGGTLFKLTPADTLSTLYQFNTNVIGADPNTPVMQASNGSLYGTTSTYGKEGGAAGSIYDAVFSPALAAPVQLTLSKSSIVAGSSVTLEWQVLNAFSLTLQQCYAYIQGSPTAAGSWTGKQSGTYNSSKKLFTGSATITPAAAGTYTYSLTCGGQESGFATLVVTAPAKTASTTTLAASPNPASVGQSVTLTATVIGSGATPGGSVTMYYGSYVLGTKTLDSGVATLAASTNGLPSGNYSLTAKYSGDSNFNASTSAAYVVKLNKAATAITLAASPVSVTPPADVTLTATVSRLASGSSGHPTGKVTFYYKNEELGSANLTASGVATLSAGSDGIPAGNYAITAEYSGDNGDLSSQSSAVVVTVK